MLTCTHGFAIIEEAGCEICEECRHDRRDSWWHPEHGKIVGCLDCYQRSYDGGVSFRFAAVDGAR